MEVGQVYEVPLPHYEPDVVPAIYKKGKAVLIQETPYLYVFKFKDGGGHIQIMSITKNDWGNVDEQKLHQE